MVQVVVCISILLAGGTHSTRFELAACRIQCTSLDTKDYIDLLWTTLAEFPGKKKLQSKNHVYYWNVTVIFYFLFLFLGLFITLIVIEAIGRRWTMASELFIFAFFVSLLSICTTRYCENLNNTVLQLMSDH